MRTVSEGEGTPFPPLFEEGIKYTGDTRKDREMIRQRDRRQKLRQEKYIKKLESFVLPDYDTGRGVADILKKCRDQANAEADEILEEETK